MKILNKKLNVVIIAGASGIGREIASAYESEGSDVFVCDISEPFIKSFKNDFPNIFINKADVSVYKDVVNFFEKVRAETNSIDVLVLNAGLQYTGSTMPIYSAQEFEFFCLRCWICI